MEYQLWNIKNVEFVDLLKVICGKVAFVHVMFIIGRQTVVIIRRHQE